MGKSLKETIEDLGFEIEEIKIDKLGLFNEKENDQQKKQTEEPPCETCYNPHFYDRGCSNCTLEPKPSKTIPISMRLEENIIEGLKEKARTLSFEQNKDISYTDLIKEAVMKNIFQKSEEQNIPGNIFKQQFLKKITKKWLDEEHPERLDELFRLSLMSRNFFIEVDQYVETFFDTYAISRRLLVMDKVPLNILHPEYSIGEIRGNVVSRRGAVPESHIGYLSNPSELGKKRSVTIPTFEIAVNPTFKWSLFLDKDYETINEIINKSFCAIFEEEEANAINCFIASAESDKTKIKVESISVENIERAKNILPYAENSVMHPYTFLKLKNNEDFQKCQDTYFVDLFPITLKKTVKAGMLFGTNISLSNTCPKNVIVFTKDKLSNGILAVKRNPLMISSREDKKLKMGFIGFEEIGIMVKEGCCSVLEEK
jgi:hypothetical protein